MQNFDTVLSKRTLREQVAKELRKQILSGKYKPGERIVEVETSEAFKISRGPVREAFRQLEEEGLLSYETNRGCVVKTLTHRDIEESYLIRSTLETLAVKIYGAKLSSNMYERMEAFILKIGEAVQQKDLYGIIQADEGFHACIVEMAECERLFRMWKSLEAVNAATYFTMNNEELMPYEVLQQNHRLILAAFEQGNVEDVYKSIDEHYMVVPQVLFESSNKPE